MERKDSKKVFAMKYVNKQACLKRGSVGNICAEVDILQQLDHAFVVGLWFTFQVRSFSKLYSAKHLLKIACCCPFRVCAMKAAAASGRVTENPKSYPNSAGMLIVFRERVNLLWGIEF